MKTALPFLVFVALAQPAIAEFSVVSNEIDPPTAQDASPESHATPGPVRKPKTHTKRHASATVVGASKPSPKAADRITGFGAEVSLAFAIRQMVPDGYDVILQPPVDPEARVDWQGGKSWKQALADAVKPLRLAVAIQDKIITIRAVDEH
ncbi:hypothetical protein M2322_004470 [Rhodoblastus acidophilus]|uniref:hypothetical protein n=1 Tax=Rhodoblastus acidophilus TaxID=1074 RepID=UPI002224E80D|nr:hypothetical protein [Rhodoblastus acidophilus]MCW2318901.1 hypothetical protein [Rhodoblastus acidophilus]